MNILIVDDHAIVRAGLTRLLRSELDADIREAATGRAAVAQARASRFDLLILDLGLPELGGLELLSRLLQASPAPILVLSMHAEPLYVSRTLAAGAQGYMSKNASPEELLNAVRKVAAGGKYIEAELAQALALSPAQPPQTLEQLSARELEILRLLGGGASLSEVADALGLGYKTIANNCTQIKARLGVRRTADLVRVALEAGVVR
jgi:two-component system invasion response regulator UvrY